MISHLLYADNTLLFCGVDPDYMMYLSWLLMWFGSGLTINLNKSEIIPARNIIDLEVLASELGCKVGALPSSVLGLPLGAPHYSMVVWDGIVERFRKKLALSKR